MNAGYIKLPRTIQNHFLWKNRKEPFDKRSAWIDLVLLANWKTHDGLYNDELIKYERGCVYRSKLELSERWGWEYRKVTRFLSTLEKAGMVHVKSTTHGTTISLTQYDLYHGDGTTDSITDAQSDAQPMHINKKEKKEKQTYKRAKTDRWTAINQREDDLDAELIRKIQMKGETSEIR